MDSTPSIGFSRPYHKTQQVETQQVETQQVETQQVETQQVETQRVDEMDERNRQTK
jgi:hypothetical protein